MSDNKQKNIKKPNILKKVLLYAAAGTAAIQFASCNKTDKQKEAKEIPEIQLYDSSDLNIDYMLKQYKMNYENRNVKGAKNEYEKFSELYEKLHSENTIDDNELKTYYYDMSIAKDSIKIKTTQGYLTIQEQDESYNIINENKNTTVETKIQYNSDGSWKLNEQDLYTKGTQSYVFSTNGMLQESTDKQGNKSIYKNGNLNCYNQYNKYDQLLKQQNSDGSYIIYTHKMDKNMLNILGLEKQASYDSVVIYYDNGGIFNHGETSNEATHNDNTKEIEQRRVFADGSSYLYEIDKDINGNTVRTYKEEKKKGQYMQYVEKNEENTIVYKYDYLKNDTVYEEINGTILCELKNDIIYKYSYEDGKFYDAYKVTENGTAHYNEDGVIKRFEDTEKNEVIYYNDEGKIGQIDRPEITISYNDYDKNLVSGINNKTTKEIEIDANGTNYKLGNDGYCQFDKNGNCTRYRYNEDLDMTFVPQDSHVQYNNGKITAYNNENEIIETLTADERIGYYDYQNNKIKYKNESGFYTSYYENQVLKSVINQNEKDTDNVITVNDQNGNEYELLAGDSIEFNENGNIEKVKQGDSEKYFFIDGNTDYYKKYTRSSDNFKCEIYYKDQCLEEADYVITVAEYSTNGGPTKYKIDHKMIIDLEKEEGEQVYMDPFYKEKVGEER